MYRRVEEFPQTTQQELGFSAPLSADFYIPAQQKVRHLREVPSFENLVPYPIIPSENFPDNPVNSDPKNPVVTRHHELFLYGSQEFISPGGMAQRVSRVLRAETAVHNGRNGLHAYYDMSPGPRDDNNRVKALLLSDAGFYPDLGIDLWSGSPVIRPIEAGEFEILRRLDPSDANRYQNLAVASRQFRNFYDKYLLKIPFLHASQEDIERFAASERIKPVREIGHQLLQDLVDSALSDFRPMYETLRETGKLHPATPIDPADLIYRSLGNDDIREQRLFRRIRRKAIGCIALHDNEEVEEVAPQPPKLELVHAEAA